MSYDMEQDRSVVVAAPAGLDALEPESRGILEGLMVVRGVLAPDLTIPELQLFAVVASRSGLDPFARQIYAVKRQGKMTIQTGIDGYRSIAARTGEYDGQDEPTYGPDCACGKAPKHPESSTVRVYRKGMSRPVGATAFWHEYVPDSAFMWNKMPHVMIAKVAEALALRKAFPWDPNSRKGIGSDIYTAEEMEQSANAAPPSASLVERVQARASSDGTGVSLRYFAEAVRDMEPDTIVAARQELFPEATGVAALTDQQRAALLERLVKGSEVQSDEEAGTQPVPDGEGEIVEAEVVEVVEEAPPAEPRPGACLSIATDELMRGALCALPKGHHGPHKNEEGSWPR